jgi:hypothetical protein
VENVEMKYGEMGAFAVGWVAASLPDSRKALAGVLGVVIVKVIITTLRFYLAMRSRVG